MSIDLEKLKKGLEEETKCQICTFLIDDPHLLFCGHAFCGICCLNWFKTNKNCPTCRAAAVRQPVHSIALQKISDLLRPEGTVNEGKLTRADWLDLYPIENHQSNYIRDVDQDGVIHRCSNCGWELDEENFCAQCMLQFEGGSTNGDDGYDMTMSDPEESNHEDEEDLEGFVVDDCQVDFETSVLDPILDDEPDSDEDMQPARRKRRRIRHSSDDDDEEQVLVESSGSSSEDSDDDNQINIREGRERSVINLDDGYSHEEEEEEEYPEDPFERNTVRNPYIDDYAEEDDEEEEEYKPKLPKPDRVLDTIANARARMTAATTTSAHNSDNNGKDDSSSSSSDSDDVEADYNFS